MGAQGFTVVTLLMGVAYNARETRLRREAQRLEREAALAAVSSAANVVPTAVTSAAKVVPVAVASAANVVPAAPK